MPLAGQLSNEVAVGTVFEARDIPSNVTPIVLTPTLTAPPKNLPLNTVMTISSPHHVIALNSAGWTGEVIVKLQSSAMRYGVEKSMLQSLLSDIENARLTVRGFAVHPPLDGDAALHLRDVTTWLDLLDARLPIYVSHLDSASYEKLRTTHPDIVDHHPIESGMRAGYRQVKVDGPGEIVLVGCGTAHGVTLLPDGRSPFHYQRQRLNVLEPPHMHTSMLIVSRGRPIPSIGEWIDVQQPMTRVQVDLLQWIK
jgi:hypothetical protein